MNIYQDEAGIIKISNEIESEKENFLSQIKLLENTLEEISNVWQGQDAVKYINVMKEKYIVALYDLNDFILEYNNFLKNIPEVYSMHDETFKGKKLDI